MLHIAFELRGIAGRASVTYGRNTRPELVGSGPESAGFPMCHATVDYPARGYNAVLGWIQLVRSNDNTSHGRAFEVDPLGFLGDVPHPFCWIGLSPSLFDAPSRAPMSDLDWAAHSFLCVPDAGSDDRYEVHALLGFTWGFRIRGTEIRLVPPALLGPAEWNQDMDVLGKRYPSWHFIRGFRSH